jgi:serine O-acetyltransferase
MASREKRPQPPRLCARGHHAIDRNPPLARIPAIVEAVVASLEDKDSADHIGFAMIPSPDSIGKIIDLYMTILMPGYYGNQNVDRSNVHYYLGDKINRLYTFLQEQIRKCLIHECCEAKPACNECSDNAAEETLRFLEKIPRLRGILARDVKAAYAGDPAARSLEEIIFCYPSIRVVTIHRFAHELFRQGVPIIPRMLSEHAHALTGCDIHPGATIGVPFFIDHGTGVVIGETTVIGDNVRIYQGVTLGGAGFEKDETGQLIRDTKRHPTIEEGCVIYAGATILGGNTVVEKGSIIGGNVWLTRSVPPGTKVVARTHESLIKPVEKNTI